MLTGSESSVLKNVFVICSFVFEVCVCVCVYVCVFTPGDCRHIKVVVERQLKTRYLCECWKAAESNFMFFFHLWVHKICIWHCKRIYMKFILSSFYILFIFLFIRFIFVHFHGRISVCCRCRKKQRMSYISSIMFRCNCLVVTLFPAPWLSVASWGWLGASWGCFVLLGLLFYTLGWF